jgi:hypothetical protein
MALVIATFVAAFFFHEHYHLINLFQYGFKFTRKAFKVLIQAPGSHKLQIFSQLIEPESGNQHGFWRLLF